MTKYSKINIVYRLQKWMDSVPGQTFLNYAYSWGASIVIAGTLFKLTHLPGANFMLFLGMGTEVVVFFLSAFDRPFDKTADGRELPTHLQEQTDTPEYDEEGNLIEQPAVAVAGIPGNTGIGGAAVGGGTIIIGGTGGAARQARLHGDYLRHEPRELPEARGVHRQAKRELLRDVVQAGGGLADVERPRAPRRAPPCRPHLRWPTACVRATPPIRL